MFKLTLKPDWVLTGAGGEHGLAPLITLLVSVHEHGSLAEACRKLDISYRNGWGLLREGQNQFGSPLVNMTRGQGTVLTPLGEKLVWAERRVSARLSPVLASLASEIEVEIERVLSKRESVLRIHASHGFAIETMRSFLVQKNLPLDLKYCSTHEALAALSAKACDVAGFHVALGEFQAPTLRYYARWLKPRGQRIVHVSTRRQGLMVTRDNPRDIHRLADLTRPQVRFINRQADSGTRALFDLLLQKERIDRKRISGYDHSEYTHAAIAAYVASGMADVGFGIEAPAERFGLRFIPLVTERYFLLVPRELMRTAAIRSLIDTLSTSAYREAVNEFSGYDASSSGAIMTIQECFPEWEGVTEGL